MSVVPLALALLAMPASAQAAPSRDADTVTLSPAEQRAEYHRLSEELHNHANRQRWNAVETAYQGCVATGAPMKAADHFQAAHAARSRGDMKAVRDRLLLALSFGATREVIDWLFAIDTTYSPVKITAVPGATLVAHDRPFDPIQGRAIDFAGATLGETGAFEGLLPRGHYEAGPTAFEVRMGKGLHEIDATGAGKRRKKDRAPG